MFRPLHFRMRRGILVCTALLTAIFLLALMVWPARLPAITIAEEEELSKEVVDHVLKRYRVVHDPFAVQYLHQVSDAIMKQLPSQPFAYHFYILQSDVENAFATPAGHIFINSGLILAMEQENELAGILAHEVAHVVCRHISKKVERSKTINIATLAGMAAGILLGASGVSEVGSAVVIGSQAAGVTAQLRYSREDEMQADRLGLQYLKSAGYDAGGLVRILNKMREKRWYGPEQIPTYMMTHPATEDRIAYISAWMETSGAPPPPPSERRERFNRFHSRFAVLYGDTKASLDRFAAAVKENPEDPVANHNYALILSETGRRQEALEHLRRALQKKPFDPVILQDMGRVYFMGGQYDEAISALESARTLDAENLEAGFYLGRTYLETNRLVAAQKIFEEILAKDPQFNQARFFLGNTYGKQERFGDAHYYLGLYYLEDRQYKKAVVQMSKALELAEDDERREEVENKLKAIRKKIPREKQVRPLKRF